MICNCTLAGTDACNNCPNNSSVSEFNFKIPIKIIVEKEFVDIEHKEKYSGGSCMVTMKHLIARMRNDQKLLDSHPNDKTILKHIEKTKDEIVQCIMKNADNDYLMEKLFM